MPYRDSKKVAKIRITAKIRIRDIAKRKRPNNIQSLVNFDIILGIFTLKSPPWQIRIESGWHFINKF